MPQANRYNIGIVSVFLLTVIYLAVSGFFMPFSSLNEEWIPLLGGFVNIDSLYSSKLIMSLMGSGAILMIVFSIYLLLIKLPNLSFSKEYVALFALFLMLLSRNGVYFSSIYIAALFMPWLLYSILIKKYFIAGFILSLSSLFYFPIILTLPIFIFYITLKSTESLKGFLISFSAVLLPIIYLLSFRYMMFNDCGTFIDECLFSLRLNFIKILPINMAKVFLILCFIFVFIHAFFSLFSNLNRYNMIKDSIIRLSMFQFGIYLFLVIIYGGDKQYDLSLLLITPLSIILADYFKENNSYISKGELVLLLCAAIVYRTSFFIV